MCGGVVVKGLAKLGNRLRHDLPVKCVDVSLFAMKRGYSPMTGQLYRTGRNWSTNSWLVVAHSPFPESGRFPPPADAEKQLLDSSARNLLIYMIVNCGLCGLPATSEGW